MKSLLIIQMLVTIMLIGCSSRTDISDITRHPRDFVDKEVSVNGTVVESFSLPFLNYYTLKDATDSIVVLSEKPLPLKGEVIDVRGRVGYYTLGGLRLIVIHESDE